MTYEWIFIAIGAVCLAVIIYLFAIKNRKSNNDVTVAIDGVIGQRCVVVEKIDSSAGCGQVRINGQGWSARAVSDDTVYEVGQVLKVVAIEGVKLNPKKPNDYKTGKAYSGRD